MTIQELTEKFNELVRFVALRYRHQENDGAAMQGDIDALLSRMTILEARVAELEAVTRDLA